MGAHSHSALAWDIMATMTWKPTRTQLIAGLVIVAVLVADGVLFVRQNAAQHDAGTPAIGAILTEAQIRDKFTCDRATEEVRDTDVFCADPVFYNNPDGVTTEAYAKYRRCSEALDDSNITSAQYASPWLFESHAQCQDADSLDAARQSFIRELKVLKEQVLEKDQAKAAQPV